MASHLFATKSLKQLLEEMHGESRLRRVLGPVQLTSLGVGAVREVDPALICKRTTRAAAIDTLPGTEQLSGAPLALHWASDLAGATTAQRITATSIPAARFICSPFQL